MAATGRRTGRGNPRAWGDGRRVRPPCPLRARAEPAPHRPQPRAPAPPAGPGGRGRTSAGGGVQRAASRVRDAPAPPPSPAGTAHRAPIGCQAQIPPAIGRLACRSIRLRPQREPGGSSRTPPLTPAASAGVPRAPWVTRPFLGRSSGPGPARLHLRQDRPALHTQAGAALGERGGVTIGVEVLGTPTQPAHVYPSQ